jgi:hypothetical protein
VAAIAATATRKARATAEKLAIAAGATRVLGGVEAAAREWVGVEVEGRRGGALFYRRVVSSLAWSDVYHGGCALALLISDLTDIRGTSWVRLFYYVLTLS